MRLPGLVARAGQLCAGDQLSCRVLRSAVVISARSVVTAAAVAVTAIGMPGLHFHDLRHAGSTLAAQAGVSLADLRARMGHDSVRTAMIYQHAAAAADQKIASTLDQRIEEARDDARDQS
jgi:integrase